MVEYRRNFVPGGTYFFTVALHDRTSSYLADHVGHLRLSIRTVKAKAPFEEIATVVLPDHMHVIWKLPRQDCDYPGRWKAIKSLFTRSLVKSGVALTKNPMGEYRLWQRRYWEHTIKDNNDLKIHIDYIHYNPVKHGCVDRVAAWPHSSFHRYVADGMLPEDWGGDMRDATTICFGE